MVVAGRNAAGVEGMATAVSLGEDERDWPNHERERVVVRPGAKRADWLAMQPAERLILLLLLLHEIRSKTSSKFD